MSLEGESTVAQRYEQLGWTVVRKGWPDLLAYRCVNGKREFRAIEVKEGADQVRPHQQQLHAFLTEAGVPVVICYVDKTGAIYEHPCLGIADKEANAAAARVLEELFPATTCEACGSRTEVNHGCADDWLCQYCGAAQTNGYDPTDGDASVLAALKRDGLEAAYRQRECLQRRAA